MQDTNENKVIYIPLVAVLLLFAIIITGIFSLKTFCFKDDVEEEIEIEETIEENPITYEQSEEEVIVEQIETEETKEETKVENTQAQVQTYVASNGESYDTVGIVNIPSLGIKYPILAESSEKLLKVSVTKYWGSNPNEVGNLCITGHNYKNSKFFGKLENIKIGDIVEITDLNGKTLNYKVYATDIVDPEDTSCTSQLTNGNIEVTLITCHYQPGDTKATKRFVVKARAEQ